MGAIGELSDEQKGGAPTRSNDPFSKLVPPIIVGPAAKISNANGSLTDTNRNVSRYFSLLQIDDVVINRISPRQEEGDAINIHLTLANDANVLDDVNARVQNLHGVCNMHRTPSAMPPFRSLPRRLLNRLWGEYGK